uniref:Crinkler (CRN) family protein n=1 Tax=Angiostrongylus cantonensis TaxID=6313 RepID=A0A0K0DNA9_ANGCA
MCRIAAAFLVRSTENGLAKEFDVFRKATLDTHCAIFMKFIDFMIAFFSMPALSGFMKLGFLRDSVSTFFMEPLCIQKIHVFQQRLLGKDWKPYIALIYGESAFGKARIELFDSPRELNSMKPHKIFLLEHCVSIKSDINTKGIPHIHLLLNNNIGLRLKCNNYEELMGYLSIAAFPKKYVKTALRTFMESSSSDTDDILFYDEYPVLFLVSTMTKKKSRAEGNYSLCFGEVITLMHCSVPVQHFPYSDIIWAAVGENSLGISVENYGLFEFICDRPLLIIDHMRRVVMQHVLKKFFYHQSFRLRNTRKENFESDRMKFEENADDEWMRLALPPRAPELIDSIIKEQEWSDYPKLSEY